MANFYDKASLVLIPSGTKEGTIFSQKPTNGDGDFTFSRSTSATRVGPSGYIEKETQNLLLQSNSFDTTWSGGATSTSGQTGYDGSSDAWLITKASTFDSRRQVLSYSGVNTFSVYAKGGSYNFVLIHLDSPSGDCLANFDLSTGTLGSLTNGIASKIEDVGGGWYRCIVTAESSFTDVRIYPSESGGYTGASGSIYIQDAQLEQGLVARDYIETTTSAVYGGITDNIPRLDYNGSCPSLKLEPQRTNLITQSEYGGSLSLINTAYTQNTQMSPEGVVNAITIASNTTSGIHYFGYDSYAFVSGTTYTSSVFAKEGTGRYFQLIYGSGAFGTTRYANYDLQDGIVSDEGADATASIVDYGNGWYRCILTATATANFTDRLYGVVITSATAPRAQSHATSLDYYIYGAQLEEASYATSYIPTYGSAVTRNSDACSVTGVSDLIGQTEGTLFLDFNPLEFDSTSRYLSIESSSGAGSGWIGIFASSPDIFRIYGDGFDSNFGGYSVGDRAKIAVAYKNGVSTSIYINGVNKGSITANTTGKDYSILKIGKAIIGDIGAGEYKKVLIFPTALTDEEAIALTTI